MQRIMGLDLGSKTIGVALSDPLGFTAQGHSVIRRLSLEEDLQRLGEIIISQEVAKIVLGFPKNMNNSIGPQAEASTHFAAELERYFHLEVVLWDERLSSRQAEAILRQSSHDPKKRRAMIDMVAAVLILESYLHKA